MLHNATSNTVPCLEILFFYDKFSCFIKTYITKDSFCSYALPYDWLQLRNTSNQGKRTFSHII